MRLAIGLCGVVVLEFLPQVKMQKRERKESCITFSDTHKPSAKNILFFVQGIKRKSGVLLRKNAFTYRPIDKNRYFVTKAPRYIYLEKVHWDSEFCSLKCKELALQKCRLFYYYQIKSFTVDWCFTKVLHLAE